MAVSQNELRIGNYLETKEGFAVCVESIYCNQKNWYLIINSKEHLIENFFAIQLTIEWLEKFDFFYDEEYDRWIDDFPDYPHYFSIYSDKKGGFIFKIGPIITRLDYVHQLQNLYYAVRGGNLKLLNTL